MLDWGAKIYFSVRDNYTNSVRRANQQQLLNIKEKRTNGIKSCIAFAMIYTLLNKKL